MMRKGGNPTKAKMPIARVERLKGGEESRKMRTVQYDTNAAATKKVIKLVWIRSGCLKGIVTMLYSIQE